MTAPRSTWPTSGASHLALPDGAIYDVFEDTAHLRFGCRVVGPGVAGFGEPELSLPLQPPRIDLVCYDRSAKTAMELALSAYQAELDRRKGRLSLMLTTPRAPRVFSCLL